MESKKISELEQYNGSADGFMIPGVADGETQKANLGTMIEHKAEAAGFLKPDGLKTINGESVAGSGDLNVAVMNPLKGTYLDTDTLPTEGQAGDYIYVVNTGVMPRTANVWAWNGTAFADTGKSVEDFGLQFASGQALNGVAIDDTGLVNPASNALAKAVDVKPLADKLADIDITKTPLNAGEPISGYIKGSDGSIVSSSRMNYVEVVVSGYEKVQFLGFINGSASTTGYCFVGSNDNVLESHEWDVVANTDYVARQYSVNVPQGAVKLKTTVNLGSAGSIESQFYCFGITGQSISDLIGEKIDESIDELAEADIFQRNINISSEITVKLLPNTMYINTSGGNVGKWNNGAYSFAVPLKETDKVVYIQPNTTNIAYFSFLKSNNPAYLVEADWADSNVFNKVCALDANTDMVEVLIPKGSKYLYIMGGNPIDARIPSALVISDKSTDTYEGASMDYINVVDGHYINKNTLQETSNSLFNLFDFDVENKNVIGIHGRIGGSGTMVFYDSNGEYITNIVQQYGVSSGYDFNDVVVVPENAVKLRVGFSTNVGWSVYDCVNMRRNEPRNLLTGKKVVFLGDSITYGFAGYNKSPFANKYTTVFCKEFARCLENNQGKSGACLAANTLNRIGMTDDRFITRATQAIMGDADVIVIWGGTNDFTYDSKAIGDYFTEETISATTYRGTKQKMPNRDNETFSGALHELLSHIQEINKTAKIIYVSALNRGIYLASQHPGQIRPNSMQSNSHGEYLQDYNEAIRVICNFYAVPVVDMTSLLGQNWANDNSNPNQGEIELHSLTFDGIHPNEAGHRRIAEVLFSYITNNRLV